MIRYALLAVALLAACHPVGNSCCNNGACPANSVCSTTCTTAAPTPGVCLPPCMVDKDCASGEVCNLIVLSCGCQAIDAGMLDGGTCAAGVGN